MMSPFTAQSPLVQLDPKHNGGVLPRNINLLAFNPHRKAFSCVHGEDKLPPATPQAEALFQEGLRLTDPSLYPEQQDYVKAAQVWQQAADLGDWRALMNLADVYLHGRGKVNANVERGVSLVEQAMQRGVADAFYLMGTLHENALGVKSSTDRAFAFYDVAVDLGSAKAQGIIGKMLDATWDSPTDGFWGNQKIGRAMLECSYAQADPNGTNNLARVLERDASIAIDSSDAEVLHARALRIYQDGAKFGSMDSVDALVSTFHSADPMNHNIKDTTRAVRYRVFSDALYANPDLKFPNLDKVLPLPPAKLPVWNGNKDDLINAAKAVVTPPVKLPPHPSTSRNEPRYHVPPGMTLPAQPVEVFTEFMVKAPRTGYWLLSVPDDPSLIDRDLQIRSLADLKKNLVPRYYRMGQELGNPNDWHDDPEQWMHAMLWNELSRAQRNQHRWEYYGQAIPLQQPQLSPLVARKLALCIPAPTQNLSCTGDQTCPQTGIWHGSVAIEHPHAATWQVHSGLLQQAYVQEGENFPTPRLEEVQASDVRWDWLGQQTANTLGADGRLQIVVPEQWQG